MSKVRHAAFMLLSAMVGSVVVRWYYQPMKGFDKELVQLKYDLWSAHEAERAAKATHGQQ